MTASVVVFEVPAEAAGTRLDQFLVKHVADRTRSAITRLIHDGQVTVDGATASKPGLTLKPGIRIRVEIPETPSTIALPQSIPLEIVHQDDHLIVVNKPAGLVVHPGHGRRDGTLVNALLGLGVPLAPAGGGHRPGIVHRLDGGTSGLLVVAKTDLAFRGLSQAFARREVHKVYQTLVWGRPRPTEGTIERHIGRSRADPLKMAVDGTRGRRREAISHFRTLSEFPGFAFVEVRPLTGRTHQIRVHMQSIHHPIVGDDRYGGRAWRGFRIVPDAMPCATSTTWPYMPRSCRSSIRPMVSP